MRNKKRSHLLSILCLTFVFNGASPATALSERNADAIVEAEISAQVERQEARLAELLEAPAMQEWTFNQAGRRTSFRKISPPLAESSPARSNSIATSNKSDPPPIFDGARSYANFTLFVTVFDEEITEIRIAPLKEGYSVVSNIGFTHLPAIETFQTKEASYSFFSFVLHVTEDSAAGRNRPDPAMFSTNDPEYIFFSESGVDIPSDVLEAVDALHRHYLKHEAQFKATAKRAKTLQAARERYLQENPPEPRDAVINFFPIRSRIHSHDKQ